MKGYILLKFCWTIRKLTPLLSFNSSLWLGDDGGDDEVG